jgi:integrase
MATRRRKHPGIVERHQRGCAARGGGRCSCEPSYEAWVSVKDRSGYTKLRQTFPRLSEAKAWRVDALAAQNRGRLPRPTKVTVADELLAWIEGAKQGQIRNRSGKAYKPSALRGYEEAIRNRILPSELARVRVSEVRRMDVQDFADSLLSEGLSGGTVANILNPLQAMYRRLVRREVVATNPTVDIELPRSRHRRERILSPLESLNYLDALPIEERALWATAFYAGLRRGELRALRVDDVDLARSELHVIRSWDAVEHEIDPKSDAGRRTIPIVAILRDHLDGHLMRTGRRGNDLVFGRTPSYAFVPSTVRSRANRAWEAAGLKPIKLHECRHTAASILIDAGISNPKAIMEFMGHSTITETYDRYGHLMPGSREEVRARVDAYLERTSSPRFEPAIGRR